MITQFIIAIAWKYITNYGNDKSIDLSVYSPPFCWLYTTIQVVKEILVTAIAKEQFLEQYEYLIKEDARVYKTVELQQYIVQMYLIILVDFGIFQTK